MNLPDHCVNADSSSWRFGPWPIIWAVLFALAYTQSPHYYSNQHHYYLHGFAQAGVGDLDEDWLANTVDPTPVYSWLVATIYRMAGPFAFQVIYFLLLVLFFESIRRLIAALPGFPSSGPAELLFLTLFLAANAAILRVASVRLTGVDYPWYLQAGLAAQYLLGPGLQPSAFGVLLVASLAAFVNGRPVLACGLAAMAAVIHSTYLLPAGLLVIAYSAVLMREQRIRVALLGGALALVLVLPVLIYNYRAFLVGDPAQLREAQRIFARVRIPHHTEFDRWFDWMAVLQIGMMACSLALVRRTRLFLVLAIPSVACVALTVAQVLTRSDSLALIFPWRFSAVLMPVSIAIIFGKLSIIAFQHGRTSRVPMRLCAIAAACLAAGGVVVMALGLGYYTNDAELPLLDFVRDYKRPNDVYLIPTRFPTIKKESPAGQSKTFAPPVRTGDAGIPVDFQRFRLSTGAPIYVDFKAPPYAAAEVLEWHERMANAQRWFAERDWDKSGTWFAVKAAGITHVVVAADKDISSSHLHLVFGDASYKLYRIDGD